MNIFLSRYYTIICVFSPLFVIYSFLGDSFTLLDTLIFVFYFISLPSFLFHKKVKVNSSLAILFLFILFHSVLFFLHNGDSSIFLRAMHLADYVFFIAYYNNTYFSIPFAYKCLRFFSLSATFFLFLQHAVFLFSGIPIPGIIPQYALQEANLNNMVDDSVVRFASFFVEPASYAQVVICALAHELFYYRTVNSLYAAILCIGCLFSTSNTALACMVLLAVFYFLKNGLFNRKVVLIAILGIIVAVLASPFIDAFITRINEGNSFNGRFEGYNNVTLMLSSPLFGAGFISPEVYEGYLSGFPCLFLYMGIIGVVVYSIVFLYLFKKIEKKELFYVFLFLNLGSNTLLGVGFLYFCSFLVCNINERNYTMVS